MKSAFKLPDRNYSVKLTIRNLAFASRLPKAGLRMRRGFTNFTMGEAVMGKINKAFLILPVVFAVLIAIGILTS